VGRLRGIFLTEPQNLAQAIGHLSAGRQILHESYVADVPEAGAFLALRPTEPVVFRIALFSIVLTLAAPQASLLCKLWCPLSDAAATECHHHDQAPTASLQGDDHCRLTAVSVPGFIREDGSRSLSSAAHAVPVPRYRLAQPARELRHAHIAQRTRVLERQPLETTLRL